MDLVDSMASVVGIGREGSSVLVIFGGEVRISFTDSGSRKCNLIYFLYFFLISIQSKK